MLFGMMTGHQRATAEGLAATIKKAERTLVLALIHESAPLKIAPQNKVEKTAWQAWEGSSHRPPQQRGASLLLSTPTSAPALPRSPWVGVIELRV